jgi:hypothetical protein
MVALAIRPLGINMAYRNQVHNARAQSMRTSRFGGETPESRVIRTPSTICHAKSDEADWDQEMSIFKQRISRPNQLATLREMESKVNLGKVRHPRVSSIRGKGYGRLRDLFASLRPYGGSR